MPLLCELGWHRPDPIARWNDGYYFAKCLRCRRDLVRTAYGQWQVPKGYRVVWQQQPPETREEVALIPAEASAGVSEKIVEASPAPESASTPVVVAAIPLATEAPAEGSFAVVAVEEPEPAPSPIGAEAPIHTAPEAIEPELAAPAPEIVQSEPARAVAETAGPISAPPSPEVAEPEPDAVVGEPAASVEPAAPVEPPLPDHYPIEELLHEANGTGAPEVEGAAPAAPEVNEARPASGRTELPIEEVLRHLHATPMPEEPVAEEEAQPVAEEATEAEQAPAAEPVAEETVVIEEAVEVPEVVESESEAEAEPVRHAVAAAASYSIISSGGAAMLQRDLPEPHFDPHVEPIAAPAPPAMAAPAPPPPPPPEPPEPEVRELKPIPTYSSDWDFMQEDEPDPIETFWEETGTDRSNAAPIAESEPEARESETPAAEIVAPHAPEPATSEVESHSAEAALTAEPIEQIMAPAAESEPVQQDRQPEPEPAPVYVMPDASEPFVAAEPPQVAIPVEGPETIPAFRPVSIAEAAAPAGEMVETPPWVDQIGEGEGEEEAPRSRKPQIAVTALASVALLAFLATIASQPRGEVLPPRPAPPAGQTALAPVKSIETPKAAAATRPSASKAAAPKRDRDSASPRRPVAKAPFPALPGREAAFVSASVLQCRSAPVEGSAPVRKLVRGAQVQILAREGDFTSVAYKGRQCWAVSRFLSAAQPW